MGRCFLGGRNRPRGVSLIDDEEEMIGRHLNKGKYKGRSRGVIAIVGFFQGLLHMTVMSS